MRLRSLFATLGIAAMIAAPASAQQRADMQADLSVSAPDWPDGKGPWVGIDDGHHNFHTATGRYAPFAKLLLNDGFQVAASHGPTTPALLADLKVFVVANPLNAANVDNWKLPTPSAFTPEEIAAIKAWVEGGGSLFLIADHMPFAGAVQDLAAAFGVSFANDFARYREPGAEVFSLKNGGLHPHVISRGVTSVEAFTGSSFTAPAAATPIMTLDKRFQIVEPQVAWKFDGLAGRPATTSDLRLAAMPFGAGRVVFASEAAMFTAQVVDPQGVKVGLGAPGAEQNKPLTLQILRWLAGR